MRRGFTIPELLISMALFSLLGIAAMALIKMAGSVERRVSGHEDAALQLKKACRFLRKDLLVTNFGLTAVADVPPSLSAGNDSVALCMLSSCVNGTGEMAMRPGGEPYWQRNVLYYVVVPLGDACQGGADARGYEDCCPHKVLIRKIIDNPPTTSPPPLGNPVLDKEALLPAANITNLLTRPPANLDLTAMAAEPNVTEVILVATNLLQMYVERMPNPSYPNEVAVTLKALNQTAASKSLAIGVTPLSNDQNTLTQMLSVFPRNIQ